MPSIVEEIIRGLERPSVSGCVGITTWIKKALMANRKFRVAGPALKKGPAGRAESTADRGLHIGRITDHAVARYYAGKIKRSRVNDIRARRIIDHIERKLELRCVATQLPVTLDEFKIKTAIDLVAVRKSKPDTVVVLEIKTTQFPLAKHNQRYNLPCIGSPAMRNGFPNTEAFHHKLQTAFGVVALQRLLPPTTTMEGRVIVACDDAVQSYKCPPSLFKTSFFSASIPASMKRATSGGKISVDLLQLPESPSSQERIVEALEPTKFTVISPTIKTSASFVASRRDDETALAVVAIIHDPEDLGSKSSKYRRARQLVLKEATRLAKRKKVSAVAPIVLSFNSNTGAFKRRVIRS